MSKLVIIRGPSGSGKSTISKNLSENIDRDYYGDIMGMPYYPQSVYHEADQFFTDNQGGYHFDVNKLKVAHQWNQLQVERSMLQSVPLVIVSNTSIQHWETRLEYTIPYIDMALDYEYELEIIRTPGPWDADTLFKRNKHNVPLEIIKKHINNYQAHPDETEWFDLNIFNEPIRP
jgi:predicted kinase